MNTTTLDVLEIDRFPSEGMPFAVDDVSIAMRLGFKPRTLWWLILNQPAAYKCFQIPKASGKLRTIHAPSEPMKFLLNRLRTEFLKPITEGMGEHVTAYRQGRSVVDAVKQHLRSCEVCDRHDVPHTCDPKLIKTERSYRIEKQPCLACDSPPPHADCPRRGVKVHLDLKDFFSNTRSSWIRDYFSEEVGYNARAANVLASVMTTPVKVAHGAKTVVVRGVPQGAPTSGDICNLVADHRLDGLIKSHVEPLGWVYTRYADDLYFSHHKNLPREEVDGLINSVRDCVKRAGWRTNNEKDEVQRPGKQQRLLGVTLNAKANIPHQQYKKIRHMLYRCWRDGFDAEAARQGKTGGRLVTELTGKLNWFKALNPAKTERLRLVLEEAKEKHNVK